MFITIVNQIMKCHEITSPHVNGWCAFVQLSLVTASLITMIVRISSHGQIKGLS